LIQPAYRRHAIGIIALALMVAGAIVPFTLAESPGTIDLQAACWRIGPLLAAVWLAYDQLKRVPVWLWCTLPVLGIAVARWPRALWVLIPALIVVAILKPRPRPRR
jgi:hypothetical protein